MCAHRQGLPALTLMIGLFTAVLLSGRTAAAEWRTYAGGPRRLFFNSAETAITAGNVGRLRVKWTFPTGAIVTAGASVARLDVPGEGIIPVAFIQSWDGNLYALRLHDGTELWRFTTDPQPGGSYPNAGSVDVTEIDGQARLYFGAGEVLYCLDALTGAELWDQRFFAGTDCATSGLCGFSNERNEIESSPIIADGKVFFGMEVNDRATGKGGFYAVDALDGSLVWYFDVGGSGATCRPLPGEKIWRFDGYHAEAELELPPGFLSRTGCDFERARNGCGNVWSSAAVDEARGLLFFASSNCDTDFDETTGEPEPPMPPYDEAIVALRFDGTPAWRWRPREEDNADLAWGAVPNLFTIEIAGELRDVVGAGNKDGTYYVIDRDGVNEISGVRWDDPYPEPHLNLPYWKTNVVPGGVFGGIIATAAVDESAGRIYFSTAPGFDEINPQRPTVHALDMNTGDVVWQNTAEPDADSSLAPTSAVPGVVFIGSVVGGFLRAYDAATGSKVASVPIGTAVASPATVVDGIVVVGAGVGERRDGKCDPQTAGNPGATCRADFADVDCDDDPPCEPGEADCADTCVFPPSEIASRRPENVTALCVPGTRRCPVLLTGKRLLVKDNARKTAKRKIIVLSKDKEALVVPEPGSAADPTVGGGQLEIFNPTTGASQAIELPAANWSGMGRPRGSKGYGYKDKKRAAGPCKKVTIKRGKGLKAVCKGSGITFALDRPAQQNVGIKLSTGAAGYPHGCLIFGGKVGKDIGTTESKAGVFKAKNAPAPGACS